MQNIEPSPHRKGSAYLAVYRYLLDDWQPYIYLTNDYGATWTRLTDGQNGIPTDYPTRVVREDPDREGLLIRRDRIRECSSPSTTASGGNRSSSTCRSRR